MKHIKLTTNTKVNWLGIKLFQLELTIDCKWGKAGDLGGWVQDEKNIQIQNVEDGFVFKGDIYGEAVIRGGEIRGGVIWGGEIWGGVIRGGVIRGGVIRGGVIRGGVIWGGEHKVSPLQIQGTKHFCNDAGNGNFRIGCKEFTLEYWNKNFKKIGPEQGYSEAQIKEYGLIIKLAIAIKKING